MRLELLPHSLFFFFFFFFKLKGCCDVCKDICHVGHDLELRQGLFFCDCGASQKCKARTSTDVVGEFCELSTIYALGPEQGGNFMVFLKTKLDAYTIKTYLLDPMCVPSGLVSKESSELNIIEYFVEYIRDKLVPIKVTIFGWTLIILTLPFCKSHNHQN